MKKISLIIFFLILYPFNVYAATLKSALKLTFENNLELQAERKNLEVQKEVLNISHKFFHRSMNFPLNKFYKESLSPVNI